MKKQTVQSFLTEKRIGLVLRVFAQKEEQIPDRVAMVKEAIGRARSIVVQGQLAIRYINVIVWADPRYRDSDCGKTTGALRAELGGTPDLFVNEFRDGDLFCGLLNYAVCHQLRHRVDYSLIASSEAFSYLNAETLEVMIEAACQGALAIGVAINELSQSILEGRLANTFAMWHNESLGEVGLFDLRAEKPIDDRLAHYMRGWSSEKGDVFYHLAGVEEVIPLARLAIKKGPCIAPILPRGEGVKQYQAPDPVKEPELWLRHVSKMGTKIERQSALLAQIDCDLTILKGGVMPAYRTF